MELGMTSRLQNLAVIIKVVDVNFESVQAWSFWLAGPGLSLLGPCL
jgi:hypothetical protein